MNDIPVELDIHPITFLGFIIEGIALKILFKDQVTIFYNEYAVDIMIGCITYPRLTSTSSFSG